MPERYRWTGLALMGWPLIVWLAGYACPGNGAIVHRQHFTIENMSGAPDRELQTFVATLEQAYTAVERFLGRSPPASIGVSLEDRRAIPSARGGTLAFYRGGGRIQDEAAAHEIVHLTTGYTSSPAIEEGLAVYVAEALAPNARHLFPPFGQAVARWVALFHQATQPVPTLILVANGPARPGAADVVRLIRRDSSAV
jgi:hypothetical protein